MSIFHDVEKLIDERLANLASRNFNADETLALTANLYEFAIVTDPAAADMIQRGTTILAPQLVSGSSGNDPDTKVLLDDLHFCSHYFSLRNLIYYSYNAPGSVEWSQVNNEIRASFADASIPRQYYKVWNDHLALSAATYAEETDSDEVRRLLKGEPEGVVTENVKLASGFLDREVDRKLAAYFSIIPPSSGVPMGEYNYAQFHAVYRHLMANALYHRRYAESNDVPGAIFIDRDSLIAELVEATELSAEIVNASFMTWSTTPTP